MGRKKIVIKPITDERNKQVTLNKRKLGLMKKAYELSVLCGCEIALIIFDSHDRNYIYGSHGTGDTLQRYMNAGEPIESHTNATIARLLNEKGKRGLGGSSGGGAGGVKVSHSSSHAHARSLVPEPIIKLPSFTPGTEAKMKDIEEKYQSYTRQLRTAASTGSVPSQPSTDSIASAASATAGAAVGLGAKAKDHGLRVHIPGTNKAFPPGTAPRPPAAGLGRPPTNTGSGSVGGSFFGFSALSSIPTPSTLLPSASVTGGLLPNLATPNLPIGNLSPSIFGLPTPNILNLTAQSPGVINLSAAGDLHVSNTAMQAHQQAAVAQLFANANASSMAHSETSSSDEDEEEEEEEGMEESYGDIPVPSAESAGLAPLDAGIVGGTSTSTNSDLVMGTAAEDAAVVALHEMSSAAQKRAAESLEADVATKRSKDDLS